MSKIKSLQDHLTLRFTLARKFGIKTTAKTDQLTKEAFLLCEKPQDAAELYEIYGRDGFSFKFNIV